MVRASLPLRRGALMLTGTARRLTAGEIAREARSLGVLAYFDGYAAGAYGRHGTQTYPRRLDRSEAEQWRAGYAEGRTERVCHSWHGFVPCVGDHPARLAETVERNGRDT